jgi:hypothetical protein
MKTVSTVIWFLPLLFLFLFGREEVLKNKLIKKVYKKLFILSLVFSSLCILLLFGGNWVIERMSKSSIFPSGKELFITRLFLYCLVVLCVLIWSNHFGGYMYWVIPLLYCVTKIKNRSKDPLSQWLREHLDFAKWLDHFSKLPQGISLGQLILYLSWVVICMLGPLIPLILYKER